MSFTREDYQQRVTMWLIFCGDYQAVMVVTISRVLSVVNKFVILAAVIHVFYCCVTSFQIQTERRACAARAKKIIFMVQYCPTCPYEILSFGGSVGVTRWLASAEFGNFSTRGELVVCEASFARTTARSMRTKYNKYEHELRWSISR